MLICITAAFMNKNKAAVRSSEGSPSKAAPPFVAAAPNRCYYHYNNICFLFREWDRGELLNQICRSRFGAAAEEKKGFQAEAGMMMCEGRQSAERRSPRRQLPAAPASQTGNRESITSSRRAALGIPERLFGGRRSSQEEQSAARKHQNLWSEPGTPRERLRSSQSPTYKWFDEPQNFFFCFPFQHQTC